MTEPNLRDQLQTSLGSTYTIQRELGGGGMSRVFVARDESLGRDIVIKLLPQELAAELSVERFTREIKLAAALQHPHVLPVLSAGVTNGLPYYTMPFVRGESLRASMAKGPMPMDAALGVLRDVARALSYAHGEGIVHRDVKPENILLSSGSAVVVDFGIAKALSASRTQAPGGTLTVVGTSIGTPAYMSPEQAAADPNIDHRADIYAWGVMAYELLAGRHPFEGRKTPQQYLAAHLVEAPAPLRKAAPTVPPVIASIVMRALEKDPDQRPQAADEIVTQLGSSASGQAPPSLGGGMLGRWKIPSAAVLILLVATVGFFIWKGRGGERASAITLAVLPFEYQGPAEQDYFVDGLTDAVNGKLAGLSGVTVIDRRSTLTYRKTTKPVKQIGSELGVQYVLGGVVRWARSGAGWRAQVMPTLVNTRDATTRWAGDPVVVSSDDPFTAQTEIATRVAGALQLALGADDRRELAERPTANTEAYDAYLRGKAIFDAIGKSATSVRDIDQAISEFRRAVAMDPKFAKGWAMLTFAAYSRASEVPGDTASIREAMESARRATALDEKDPMVVDIRSAIAFMQGDQDRGVKIVSDAIHAGIVNPQLLSLHAYDLSDRNQMDSATRVINRAVRMSPRDVPTLLVASDLASERKDWAAMERYSRAMIAVDPTDERGWKELAQMARYRGDSLAMRRVIEEAFRFIPSPSNLLLAYMVYAGDAMGSRFVRMTPEQLRIESIADSIATYYDNKADYYVGRGEPGRARIYYDSIIGKLEGRDLSGPGEPYLRLYLSHAYSAIGRIPDARTELERTRRAARAVHQVRADGTPDLDQRIVAGILANTGQHDAAVRELREFVGRGSWTRTGVSQVSKLRALRGNPAYEAFLREPEQR